MSAPASESVTRLLERWRRGDQGARDRLWELTYDDLRRLAHRHVRRERYPGAPQTTALVHETFLEVSRRETLSWKDRSHFLSFASRAMRRILIDEARARLAKKRRPPEGACEAPDGAFVTSRLDPEEMLAVDQALDRLAELDARQAQLVELRFFGGLEVEEAAEVLEISPRTAAREWRMARAWLRSQLSRERCEPPA